MGYRMHAKLKEYSLDAEQLKVAKGLPANDGACEWVPKSSHVHIVETLRDGDAETAAFAATLAQQLAKRSKSAADHFHELGATPLLMAAQNGQEKCVELLLGKGANGEAWLAFKVFHMCVCALARAHPSVFALPPSAFGKHARAPMEHASALAMQTTAAVRCSLV